MKITNSDLYKQQFSEDIILANFDNLNLKRLLRTQKLSAEFCIKYVLCLDNIDSGDEDSYLFDTTHILRLQPHIEKNHFINLLNNNN